MKREGELRVINPPEVALHAAEEPDARLGRAVAEDRRDLRQFHEGVEDRHRVFCAE